MYTTSSEALIVLPKYSAFEFKDINQQMFYKSRVKEWLEYLRGLGLTTVCFAEDMLAVSLLASDLEMKWVSVVGKSDALFIKNSMEGYPQEYKSLRVQEADQVAVRNAVTKYKAKPPKFFGEDVQAYEAHKLNNLHSRIRYVANEYINRAKIVIYFNANNNFCNEPSLELGSGNIFVRIEPLTETEHYYFGGFKLDKENFYKVMEGL